MSPLTSVEPAARTTVSLCLTCDFDDALDFLRCPACGGTSVEPLPWPKEEAPVARDWMCDPYLVKASDLEITTPVMVRTGTVFDRIGLGEAGVPLSRLLLLSGPPGSGKSHLARGLAGAWSIMPSALALYVAFEEPLLEVHHKMVEGGYLVNRHALLLSRGPFSSEALARLIVSEGSGLLVVIDSLQAATVGAPQLRLFKDSVGQSEIAERQDLGPAGTVRHCLALIGECKEILNALPRTTILLVCHETKDEKVAGPRAVEHLVDVVMSLKVRSLESGDPDDPGATLSRELRITKNRIGQSHVTVAV